MTVDPLLSAACPVCGVAAGEPCVGRTGRALSRPHDMRPVAPARAADPLASVDAADDGLAPGLTPVEVRAWCGAHGVGDWVTVRPLELVAHLGPLDADWVHFWMPNGTTLIDLICAPTQKPRRKQSRDAVPAAVQQVAVGLLRARAARAGEAEADEAELAAREAAAPLDGPLRGFQRRLQAAREGLREGVAPVAMRDRTVAFELKGNPPALAVRLSPPVACAATAVEAVWVAVHDRPDRPLLRCGCPDPDAPCVARLAALDALRGALLDPAHEALRAALLKAWAVPLWARAIDHLDAALAEAPASPEPGARVAWLLTAHGRAPITLTPAWAVARKRGDGWRVKAMTQPALAALDRAALEPADRAALDALRPTPHPYTDESTRLALTHRALRALEGHPLVFLGGQPPRPLQVKVAALGLRWSARRDGGAGIGVRLGDAAVAPGDVLGGLMNRHADGLWADLDVEAGRLRLVPLGARQVALLEGLDRFGVEVPAEGVDALLVRLPALDAVAPVTLDGALRGAERPADPRWLLRLDAEAGAALRVELRVRPAPEAEPRLPGRGPAEVYGGDAEGRFHVRRDFAAEVAQARARLGDVPLPDAAECGPWAWYLAEPAEALAALEAIQAAAEGFEIVWRSPPRRLTRPAGAGGLSLGLKAVGGGFALGGGLSVDGVTVDVAALLDAVRAGRDFVEAADGTLVRLAADFAAQLQALAAVAQAAKEGPTVAPFAAPLVDALRAAGAEVEGPRAYRALVERARAAEDLQPAVPADLGATLRPYQREGFVWMARLTAWGAGACLADDMGLGKTVQALALLLHRREAGPALVVAPTSVGFNWQREAARFAAPLRARAYRGAERAALLDDLRPGDLLVTSYDLLARDREALTAVAWGTVILDEAQAIKNPATRRARAAAALTAEARIALTGTPIENHLGELWSLFRFLAPGLLGGAEAFRARFARPIQRDEDADARARLQALVAPFVLRRTKDAVAPDLPARTEVTVDIELSDAERRLYDRARAEALAGLGAGPGHVQVLAVLTRLRQLACHPRLVDPRSSVPSSKLTHLRALVAELVDEGHQVLVFSQFTAHLDLAQAALAEDGHRLQRLDGGTPAEARQRAVDAFQAGDGDVFLISLKAGGTGLNLTAASYVIHLDPWWNPAAEDQATDRAHRIGQTRPVTVYRLVAQDTIEQAIVALHHQKRALVAQVLEGSGAAAGLSTDELVALLRAGAAG
ncbi:MAG: DEAD/DEAH box helicase [Myxococcales bacterium]|nr:DEAD/DEAH box helicase [Myxococcales bacterium]